MKVARTARTDTRIAGLCAIVPGQDPEKGSACGPSEREGASVRRSRMSRQSFLVPRAAGFGLVTMMIVPLAAQTTARKATPAATAASEKTYRAPRTPWGDPDLQGIYSNAFENGTPLERPQQFEGRRLEDITAEELLQLKKDAHERALINFAGGLHAPDHFWQHYYEVEKGGQAWLIIDPPDGKVPSLTTGGQRRNATRAAARRASGRGNADSHEDRSLYDRCITRGLPGSMMPAIYGSHYDITQSPGYVVIRYEMVHEARVIPLNAAPHAGSNIRMYMGDPRGHWDGDTLVVETTNFTDKTPYQGSSPHLRIVERFTRVAPDRIRWSVTFDDPHTWVRPWTFAMPLTMDPTQPVYEYSCHEGNYGLANILSAARADERKFEEYRKRFTA
jgi:hypothetical protein